MGLTVVCTQGGMPPYAPQVVYNQGGMPPYVPQGGVYTGWYASLCTLGIPTTLYICLPMYPGYTTISPWCGAVLYT